MQKAKELDSLLQLSNKPMLTGCYIFRKIENKEIIFIPRSKNKHSWPVEIDQAIRLKQYQLKEVGKAARAAIIICEQYPLIDIEEPVSVVKKELGYNWNKGKLEKLYESVDLISNPEADIVRPAGHIIKNGYTISPSKARDGAFRSTTADPEFYLPMDCSDEELGETVIKAFDVVKDMAD
jgi:hypothetical protein